MHVLVRLLKTSSVKGSPYRHHTQRRWSLPALSALPLKLPRSTAVISPLLLLETVLGFAQSPLNRRLGCFKSTRVKKTTPCKHKSKESRSGCINASVGFQVGLLLRQRGAPWSSACSPGMACDLPRVRTRAERAPQRAGARGWQHTYGEQ